jgi:hypothetical protein
MFRLSAMAIRARSARAALAACLALTIVLPASVGAASAPLVVHDDIDSTVLLPFLSDVCGFDIYSHLEGSVTSVVQFDADGNPDREVTTGLVKRTFFSTSTDQSVTFPLPLTSIVDYAPDGSAIAFDAGLFINVHVAGGQPIRFVAGRDLYTAVIVDINPAGVPIHEPIDLLSSSGTDRGSILGICTALEA